MNPERERLINEGLEKIPYKIKKAEKKYKKALTNKENKPSSYKDNKPSYKDNQFNDTDLLDDISLILLDTKNLTPNVFSNIALKKVDKFINKFSKKIQADRRNNDDYRNTQSEKKMCNIGDNCIIWYCKYEHSKNRQKECSCDKSNCGRLHSNQALCKNPEHPDNCQMAHNIKELESKNLKDLKDTSENELESDVESEGEKSENDNESIV